MAAIDDLAAKLGINLNQSLPSNQSLGMGQVYMGQRQKFQDVPGGGRFNQRVGAGQKEDYFMSANEASSLPAQWDSNTLSQFVANGTMRKIPGFSQGMGLPEVLNHWNDWVNLSAELGKSGINMTPWDIMNSYTAPTPKNYRRGNWLYDGETGQPIQYVGPLTKTDTATKIDLSSREDALALAKNSMAQLLGRAPTDNEVTTYLNALNGYERENPMVSTTTSQISPETGEITSSKTQTTGGVTQAGRQALLEQKMQGTKEYGAYQASTTYMSAMMQALMRGY